MKGKGVRKGAWTAEEDGLLKQCIQTFGEGNWHLVPTRAGLNRCRKSCRFRWLNYLKPGINRRELQEDEVDLILRLHKLLGNKWTLIAGRLPGRTSNDVKNYWNSHIAKKWKSSKASAESSSSSSKGKQKQQDLVKLVNVIRPIARRAPKIKFGISQLPPPAPDDHLLHYCNGIATENDEMRWLERLMDADIDDFGGGGDGGCAASEGHCTAAATNEHLQAAGGGYSYIHHGSILDELYIDDIFQL